MSPDGIPADFQLTSETFDPIRFFSGKFVAQGMFVDRFGSVQRRFAAEVNCLTNDNQTELHEAFIFDDGETEHRVWTITRNSDGSYVADTDDIDGRALCSVDGPVFKLRYDFFLNMFGRRVKVRFNDIMVRQTDTTILNRAKVSKFGLLLGELVITFTKAS